MGRVRKGAITKARAVRAEHGVALDVPLPDLLRFVERDCGVPVVILEDLGEDLAGAYLPNGGRPVIFLNGTDGAARMRFTLAPELGPHVFRASRAQDTLEGLVQPGHWREVRANAFAAELLIPEPAVLAWARDRARPASVRGVADLAGTFGTSHAASAIRLATAGL